MAVCWKVWKGVRPHWGSSPGVPAAGCVVLPPQPASHIVYTDMSDPNIIMIVIHPPIQWRPTMACTIVSLL
jgi:hypothetical protein